MSKQKFEIVTMDKNNNSETVTLYYDKSDYGYNQFYKRLIFSNFLAGMDVDKTSRVGIQYEDFVNNYIKNGLSIKTINIYVDDVLIKTCTNCTDIDYSIESWRDVSAVSRTANTNGIATSAEMLKIILS